jgi:hypothetical protein
MLVRFLRLAKYCSFVLQEQNHRYIPVAMKNPARQERGFCLGGQRLEALGSLILWLPPPDVAHNTLLRSTVYL